jgi:hypothetical protein
MNVVNGWLLSNLAEVIDLNLNIFLPLYWPFRTSSILYEHCTIPPNHLLLDSPLSLDQHSYLNGKLTSSKIADTKVSGF